MRRCVAILVAVLLVFLASGCGKEKTVSIGYDLSGVPRSLDPQIASDQSAHVVISNIFEGLFRMDESGGLQNAVAESYEISPDRMTYTFQLRKDAQWTYDDAAGNEVYTPVTADDFVFGFQRLLLPSTNSPAARRFFCIQNAEEVYQEELEASALGVQAVGEHTLRIELTSPNENFLNLLSTTYAMPCNRKFFEQTMGRYGLETETILSNGCFEVYTWTKGSEIRLVRNEGYRNADEVIPDVVKLYLGTTSEDAPRDSLARLLEGKVDAALIDGGLDGVSGKGYNSDPVENAVWGLYINWNTPGLANSKIREAIALTLDRGSYAGLLSDNLTVAKALIPHDVAFSGESFRALAGDSLTPEYNPSKGYELFKEGLNELNRSSAGELRVLINKDAPIDAATYFHAISQVFQKELSLFIAIDEVNGDEFGARLASGDFDIAFYCLQSYDNTPWSILSSFLSDSPSNYSSYANADFDAILNAAEFASERSDAREGYLQAERLLLEDAAFLPLCYSTDYFVTRPETAGITYNPCTGLVDFRIASRQ